MLSLRLTPELFDELRRAAQAQGVPVSTYVRRCIEARLRPAQVVEWCSTDTVGYEPLAGICITYPGGSP